MKALITSAGKGTRLEHLTHVTNKGLIKVGKVTLLEHTISALNGYGINEIYIITGHHYANVEKKMKGKAKCIYNPFYSVSGIIASIWFAKNYLQGQKFIFTPCDHIFHPKLLENCLNAKEDIVVSVEKKECDLINCSYPPGSLGQIFGFQGHTIIEGNLLFPRIEYINHS